MPERRLSWLVLATHVPADGSGGGMVRYVVELARALARHPEVELSLLARPDAVTFLQDELALPPGRVRAAPARRTLVNSLFERSGLGLPGRRGGFDVVHGTKHLVPALSSAARLLTVHDMILLERPDDFGLLKRRLLGRPYLASVAAADAIVAVSGASARRVAAHVPAAAARTTAVPLAVAPGLIAAEPVPVAGLDGGPTALVVSDFSPRKNLPFLLRCWPEVRARRPRATLVIVGPRPAPGSPAAAELAAAEARGGVVHLGRLADAELRFAYETAQLTLCPSVVEGFGLPALEAVTFACPVLVSDDPALAEAAGGRATPLPTSDARAWVAAITAALARPRPAAPAVPTARSWHDVAAETVTVARTAVARRRRDRGGGAPPARHTDRLGAL